MFDSFYTQSQEHNECFRYNRYVKSIIIYIMKENVFFTEWKTFHGKFFMVNGANVSCACSRSPNGISPYCHLGDGCVDVLIIKHTNMLNNLRLLLRLSSKEKNVVCNLILKLCGVLRISKCNATKCSDAENFIYQRIIQSTHLCFLCKNNKVVREQSTMTV